MRDVEPSVYLIGKPQIDTAEMRAYLEEVDGVEWLERVAPEYRLLGRPGVPERDLDLEQFLRGSVAGSGEPARDGEALIEFAARLCYRSWKPGLNANVTRVREDIVDYFANVLSSGHGSVFEHAYYVFVFHNVSRVFTHEMVRHRAGTSFSQESMRFVRLTDLPIWTPDWAKADAELMERNERIAAMLEEHQLWMADHFELDATKECANCDGKGRIPDFFTVQVNGRPSPVKQPDGKQCPKCDGSGEVSAVPFSEKKAKTSYMRRWAPDGVATSIVVGGNIRAFRHIITMRTDTAAEEEIVKVFSDVAAVMMDQCPAIFQDFNRDGDMWVPSNRKV